jgi:hypothetical protein
MPVPAAKSSGFWVQPCSITMRGTGWPRYPPGTSEGLRDLAQRFGRPLGPLFDGLTPGSSPAPDLGMAKSSGFWVQPCSITMRGTGWPRYPPGT